MRIYQEIIDFVTSSPSLEDIVAYQMPEEVTQRVRYLIEISRKGQLTPEEQHELDEFTRIEYFLTKLKKRARRRVSFQN